MTHGHVPALSLLRRAAAEALGTGLLVTAVVGSGIAAQTLSPDDTGLALLENAFATAGALFALILLFGPVSGAHLNPVVSIVDGLFGRRPWRDIGAYIPAQIIGAVLGALLANAMFDVPFGASTTQRTGSNLLLGEVVATFGLVLLIFGLLRAGTSVHSVLAVPTAVAAYIAGAYWFTSSTSFANPAVTIGRAFSDTFAGIAPSSVPSFVVAQCLGAVLAALAVLVWWPFTATAPSTSALESEARS
jgi:glycerol uptake facilitator-like aquaporin